MKILKKLVSILVLTLLTLSLVGCGPKPDETVKNFLDAAKKSDFNAMSNYVENGTNKDSLKFDSSDQEKVIKTVFSKIDYSVLSSKVNGKNATVKVKITSPDLPEIYAKVVSDALPDMIESAFTNNQNESAYEKKLLQQFLNAINNSNAKKTTTDVDIKLVKSNKKWLIEANEDLANALTGNLNKAFDNTKTSTNKKKINDKRKVEGKATDLGAGTFTCGKDIEPGTYDLTPSGGEGYITVKTSNIEDPSLGCTMDKLGSEDLSDPDDNGIPKMRLKLVKGDNIEINDVSKTHFEPVTTPFVNKTPKNITLYAGRFVVGEDIAPGRYKISAEKGSGSVYIFSERGQTQQNISDHKTSLNSNDPKEATITLKESDPIFITNIAQTTFTPVQ